MVRIISIEDNIKDLKNNYNEIKIELMKLKEEIKNNNDFLFTELDLKIDNIILKKQNEYLESQLNSIINKNDSSKDKVVDLNSIKIGKWIIKADNNDLCFYKDDLKIATLSSEHDILKLYRNKNGKPPYFYYNTYGDYKEWKG